MARSSRALGSQVDVNDDEMDYEYTMVASPSINHAPPEQDIRRRSTDRATVTLAQRLNELAASNADGLLGDEEYRMLRQNLFERFGAGSQIPSESPVVKLSPPEATAGGRPMSTHHSHSVDASLIPRPPSVASNSSRITSVTSRLRSALRRSSGTASRTASVYDSSHSPMDGMSIVSGPSTSGGPSGSGSGSRRGLQYQPSLSSLKSSSSGMPAHAASNNDARSISSYKTGYSSRTGRTSNSKGPPSSYHRPRRGPGEHSQRAPRQPLELDGDESAAELRAEIDAVEMEKRQLMDNFQGLEISAVTRSSQDTSSGRRLRSPSTSSSSGTGTGTGRRERPSSMWTVTPQNVLSSQSQSHPIPPSQSTHTPIPQKLPGPSIVERKRSLGMLSTASAKFARSASGSGSNSTSQLPYSPLDHPTSTSGAGLGTKSAPTTPAKGTGGGGGIGGFFRRKVTTPSPSLSQSQSHSSSHPSHSSSSSHLPKSHSNSNGHGTADWAPPPPPVPPLPSNLTTPPLPSAHANGYPNGSPEEPDPAVQDIRRKRSETAAKYDERLEFLRARLKGAELRERLTR